ncbi:MAG: hypothetical protein ACYSW3_02255 [Planctomycetota bacterium]
MIGRPFISPIPAIAVMRYLRGWRTTTGRTVALDTTYYYSGGTFLIGHDISPPKGCPG